MQTMMRNAAAVGAALVLVAALSAGPATAASEKIVIGFSQATFNSPWRTAMINKDKQYVAEHLPDVDFVVTDGEGQASKQVSDIESLMARGVNALMVSPVTSQALTPIVKQAMAKGIPVITIDRKVNTTVTTHVGALNRPIGAAAATFIAEKLQGKGNIVEIQGTAGASATIDRDGGFKDELKNHPDLKIVASQYADYRREPAYKFIEDIVQRFQPGQVNVIYSHNDEMALGAIMALKAAHRMKDIMVVSIDGQEKAFEAIKAGELAATFIYPLAAPEGVQYAYKVAKGEKVPPDVVLPSQRVDASNVDQFIGKGF